MRHLIGKLINLNYMYNLSSILMEDPSRLSSNGDSTTTTSSNPPPHPSPSSLVKPSDKKKNKHFNAFRLFRSVFRSFPILSPACRFPSLPGGVLPGGGVNSRVTGTLFGHRKGRVSLSVQQNPMTVPTLVMELTMQTHTLQKEMSLGFVRIVMECEKRPEKENAAADLLEEPVWTMYYNGKKSGYGLKREPTAEDLHLMELLKAMSIGVGVLPWKSWGEGGEEMVYMRADFNRVVGSKNSETLHMLSPDGNYNGPQFSILFVRV